MLATTGTGIPYKDVCWPKECKNAGASTNIYYVRSFDPSMQYYSMESFDPAKQ